MDPNKKLKSLHILVVEDDPKSLDLIQTLLEFHGAKVSDATNGFEGSSFARQLKPDFIISDLSMPVMDGWQMIKELKKEQETSDIPIIALSAHVMRGDREKAMAAGCDNFMAKPIDPYTFIDTLISILEDIPNILVK